MQKTLSLQSHYETQLREASSLLSRSAHKLSIQETANNQLEQKLVTVQNELMQSEHKQIEMEIQSASQSLDNPAEEILESRIQLHEEDKLLLLQNQELRNEVSSLRNENRRIQDDYDNAASKIQHLSQNHQGIAGTSVSSANSHHQLSTPNPLSTGKKHFSVIDDRASKSMTDTEPDLQSARKEISRLRRDLAASKATTAFNHTVAVIEQSNRIQDLENQLQNQASEAKAALLMHQRNSALQISELENKIKDAQEESSALKKTHAQEVQHQWEGKLKEKERDIAALKEHTTQIKLELETARVLRTEEITALATHIRDMSDQHAKDQDATNEELRLVQKVVFVSFFFLFSCFIYYNYQW